MADQNPSISQSKIIQRNGKSVQILSYLDGLREERQLDAAGIANGDYSIYRGDKCIESGTLKNGKRDGEAERYDKEGNLKSIVRYKDGKERKIINAILGMYAALNRLNKKVDEYSNQELLRHRTQAYVWFQSLKELFNKMTGFEKLRESFLPRHPKKTKEPIDTLPKGKSNHELLASHASRQRQASSPVRQPTENQTFKHTETVQHQKLDIGRLADLAGKSSRGS